jgi:uncharacterized protein (TIGR02679 family)
VADGAEPSPDTERLRKVLGDPGLSRLVERLVRRLELSRRLDGTITLQQATEAERQAVARLIGRRPGHGTSLSVPLPAVEAALRAAGLAQDLHGAVQAVAGSVTARADQLAAQAALRQDAIGSLRGCRHADEEWFGRWLDEIAADGTITRLIRRGEAALLRQASAVLSLLPADGVPLPALAERATGNTKALSRGPLAGLVLRALAHRESVPAPVTRAGERLLWESSGVIPDDLSSQVLVLGLPAGGGLLGTWLTEAAKAWIPFRITLHQLAAMPVVPHQREIYVCENPSVLRAAVASPSHRAAVVCTEGMPSTACHRLLESVTGLPIRWRGDFDWAGLRTTAMAIERYAAVPWRMSSSDYQAALESGESEPLPDGAAASPWDEALAARMKQTGRAVMEERLIPALLADLTS